MTLNVYFQGIFGDVGAEGATGDPVSTLSQNETVNHNFICYYCCTISYPILSIASMEIFCSGS